MMFATSNQFIKIISLIFCYYAILQRGICENIYVEGLCMLISTICIFKIFSKSNCPYSFDKVYHIFYLFFFSIAPIIQFKNNVALLGTHFSDSEYIMSLFLLLVSLVLYEILYAIFYKKIKVESYNNQDINEKRNKVNELILILISFSILIAMLFMNNFNVMSLLLRGGEYTTRQEVSQTSNLIIGKFIRPMSMLIFLCAYIRKDISLTTKLILFILLFLSICPTGVARNVTAAIWLPVLLTVAGWARKRNVFSVILVGGLLIAMPLLNQFRHYEGGSLEIGLDFSQFEELHFDAFSMFMRVVKDDIITYGNQFLGSVLFFIPRSVWPDKPVGSGCYVADLSDLSFSNISMPFLGEGFINWGYPGLIFFIVLISYYCSWFDKNYWETENNSGHYRIKYLILMSLLLFMLRGDFMSSFAYTCGLLLSYKVVSKIV